MYKWAKEKKFSTSRTFLSYNFTPKNFKSLTKISRESINYNQLPVIKEEEGYLSETETELNSLENLLFKNRYINKATLRMDHSKKNMENQVQIKEAKTFTKLPPLVNINCLMNTEIKQSHHIWDTNFGKHLISGRNYKLEEQMSLPEAKEVNMIQNRHAKKSTTQHSKFSSKRCAAEPRGGGDTMDSTSQKKVTRKKPKKISKTNQNLSKKFCHEKEFYTGTLGINETKSSVNIMQILSKEKLEKTLSKEKLEKTLSKEKLEKTLSKENLEKTLSKEVSIAPSLKEETIEITPTASTFSKNRHFLMECVKSILDNTPNQHECEHCKEQFSDIEELCQHKKQHELKKEICLLCEKVFYNPKEFIQHLLSHEGVDKFSCKKCKKYFPNLKKYKQHCHDFHPIPEKTSNYLLSETSLEYVKRWLPQYKCKRCNMEFDFEKELEEHKRNHIKTDLAGAYLLSPNNI